MAVQRATGSQTVITKNLTTQTLRGRLLNENPVQADRQPVLEQQNVKLIRLLEYENVCEFPMNSKIVKFSTLTDSHSCLDAVSSFYRGDEKLGAHVLLFRSGSEHIRTGYRPEIPSLWSCLHSWSYIHNETGLIKQLDRKYYPSLIDSS